MAKKNKTQETIFQPSYSTNNKRLIVVLGMHRSGTSALTKGLETLGVSLGDNLMPAAENNNEKGFFEDIDIAKINDSLLAKLGSSWDKLGPIDCQKILGDNYRIERQDARRLLQGKLNNCAIFGFKDPRVSILLPFWQQLFNEMNLDVSYIISIRNPLSVATSLHKRDGMHEATSFLLWLKYISSALSGTVGAEKIIVDYDQLMLDPEGQLNRIAANLSLPNPNIVALTEYSSEFLSSKLRHNIYGAQHLSDNLKVPSIVAELYLNLLAATKKSKSNPYKLSLIKLNSLWDEITPILNDIDSIVSEVSVQKNEINNLKNELQSAGNGINMLQREAYNDKEAAKLAQATIVDMQSAIAAKTEIELSLHTKIVAIQDSLLQQDKTAEQLQIKLTSITNECATAWSMNDQTNQEKILLGEQLAISKNEKNALAIQLSEIKDEYSKIISELSLRDSAAEQLQAQLTTITNECTTAWSMNDQTNQDKMALAEQLANSQNVNSALNIQLAGLLNECSIFVSELSVRDAAAEQVQRQLTAITNECATAWSINDQTNQDKMALAEQLARSQDECSVAWSMNHQANQDRMALAEQLTHSQDECSIAWSMNDQTTQDRMAIAEQLTRSQDECSVAWSMNDQSTQDRMALAEQLTRSQDECSTAWSMNDQANQYRMALAEQTLHFQAEVQRLNSQQVQLLSSTSWRLTRPLRAIRRHYHQPLFLIRALISTVLRTVWRKLPGLNWKLSLKTVFFTVFGFVLRPTKAYQDWKSFKGSAELHLIPEELQEVCSEPTVLESEPVICLDEKHGICEPVQNVPLLLAKPAEITPAKVIAFYLPQFHPIAENNEWWGEGFTEWTNVRPAQMQYQDHYQPHVPGDLGYYSLLDIETQRQQVELAKLYGVGGFCFYYYWFAGKRLLETPIEQYLNNPELDLPFCLCWANENWSRRWDGLDSEILMAQEYSEADDLAFIENMARYLKDPRYIRIDGRPLLLVYRPSLLPSARKTAQRWRKWCLENGIGEIYLAYTQSFEREDPAKYGFDAAIEFPPNNTAPTNVTEQVVPLTEEFSGQVYDYSIYLERSKQYHDAGYNLFRGVCPSWDNTARRKNNGISFINSSPRGYQEWLVDAIEDTCMSRPNADERLVFVNAWNEWAEGAHLEPDQRYGYGFLEATRMAQLRSQLRLAPAKELGDKLAVVVHAFYPEVFAEIVGYLNAIDTLQLKLFISCPADVSEQIRLLALGSMHDWAVYVYPNHGRDIVPFLKVLPDVISEGYEYLIKVHTKKSIHREDGDVWRRDLYDKLLKPESINQGSQLLADDPSLGVLGPDGHVVPMGFYWGSNAATVEKLACRLGAKPDDLNRFTFVAGTMFMARTSAFLPLLNLALTGEDFESEAGQVDGTLAHAIERAITISAWAAGMHVTTMGTAAAVHKDYAFAKACV